MTTITADQRARQRRKARLDARIETCQRCGPTMNVPGETQSAPGFGSVCSPVVIVGQSLCGKPCMDSQIPFTRGSGKLIDEALASVGKDKSHVFTTNVVHCHPPRNHRSLPEWIKNCTPYLHRELEIVQPKLIIALGKDAQAVLQARYPETNPLSWERQRLRNKGSPDLRFAPHPSHILKPWVQEQYPGIRDRYVASLTRALRFGFGDQ
ncbi:uracil-DNA glycosylase [Mycobacterium interjectum]|uniref:uracil-DNA glycosylase n=1 Tax=Mycobacterium interjectum TaxID=33895 RepID=UPI000A074F8B|nr:uracil-DNA glycosylase family protein [Mycobacterium interjectum]MCV7092673.1 uracil-DNA glycosylase [Mycobacterium interjectum]